MAMVMAGIVVDALSKRFGSVLALSDVSFTAQTGRVTAVLGPNGSGKSTLLRSVLGLVELDSGTARIGGKPYREHDQPARMAGAVLETAGFHPGRRARDHLRILAAVARLPTQRVDAALVAVGLSGAADRRVGGFSLGMRQRLGVAAALLGDPQVLVLDEPTNGLDPHGIHWLRGLVRRLADEGRTVLLASHVLAEVAHSAHDVLVLHNGRLVAQASVSELGGAAGLEEQFLRLTACAEAQEVGG